MIVTDSLDATGVIQLDCLIDQHHWNIIADLIQQATGFTDQPIAILRHANVTFAFGASQNP
jgi:hypothetical protein